MDWKNADKTSKQPDSDKLSVLLVEDEAPIRETLREFFLGKEYNVSVASNGEQAAEILASELVFDLVITDMKLPVGSGVEVLRRARKTNPAGYVVFMTGFASLESAIEAVRLGAFEYLVKPFSLSELELTLERVVQHRRLATTNRRLHGELEQLRPFRDLDRRHQELKASIEQLTREVARQSEMLQSLTRGSESHRGMVPKPVSSDEGAENLTAPVDALTVVKGAEFSNR